MIPTAPAHDVASRLPHLTSREGDRQKHFFPNSNHATQTAFRSRKHDSHTERRSRLLLRIPQGPLWSPPEPRRAAHSPRRSRRPSVVWKTAPICQNHSAAHALHGKSSTLYSERARSWWWRSVSSGWREWSRLTWQHSSSLVSYTIFCQNIIKFTDYNTPNTYFLCCGGKKKRCCFRQASDWLPHPIYLNNSQSGFCSHDNMGRRRVLLWDESLVLAEAAARGWAKKVTVKTKQSTPVL